MVAVPIQFVNATGGSPAANADLAKQVEEVTRAVVGQELRKAMRPGGLVYGAR